MKAKVIKNEAEHTEALARIEEIFDAKPGTPEGDELELLTLLVDRFEREVYPIELPDPVAAIKFRMEQQGLKAKDLAPYIGSPSKVSEVLSGKRSLSLTMIRKLVNKVGIPAEVLLQEPGTELPSEATLEQWRHFPIAEMARRGWFPGFHGTAAEAKIQLEDLLNRFVGPLGPNALIPAMNRQRVRDGGSQDTHALTAWRIRVARLALREPLPPYKAGVVSENFLRELARLSYLDSGPTLAREFLNKSGIHLVCEPHLPRTHLDGAALKLPDGSPVVALTLRYDRLDHFWFTLFHELAHVSLHLYDSGMDAFFDDLTNDNTKDLCEREADNLASNALIPEDDWKAAGIKRNSPSASVVKFAEKHRISPAIPAGRVRYEARDFKVFKGLIGAGKVRPIFGLHRS